MNINVTRTEVIVGNGYIVNKGEYKINPCVFTFSQEYTANLVKKAVFDDGKTTKEMAIINNRCELPYEVLDSDSFQLRVYAYRVNEQELELVYSPTPAIIYLREGSYRGVTGSGEIITPTQYEQYEQALNDGLDDLEAGLQEVSNVDIDVSKSGNTATVTITDRQGTEKSVEIFDGDDYVLTEEDKQEIINTVEAEVSLDIPTKLSQLENDSAYINKEVNNLTNYTLKTSTGSSIELSINSSTYVMTLNLKNQDGTVISTGTVDLPLETMVVGATYDNTNKKIVLTLKNGSTIDVPVGDLVSGLQSEITSSNKLNADLVDDTNSTHKFTNATEKAQISANTTAISNIKDGTSIDSFGDVETALSGKEDKSNKVTSIDENSTNTQYPGAKLVYDELVERDEEINQLWNDHPDILDNNALPSGTDLTLNGTGDLKMKVDVGGNSTQIQYEGYNKLEGDTLYSNTVTDTRTSVFLQVFLSNTTVGSQDQVIVNNITISSTGRYYYVFTPNSDKVGILIKHNGLQTDLRKEFSIELQSGTTYTVSLDITGINPTVQGGFSFKDVMVYEGSTQKPYEPFVGNQVSPNPAYKQDINNVEGNVVVISKNSDNTKSNSVTFPLATGQKLMLGDTLEDDGIHHKRKQVIFDGITEGKKFTSFETQYSNRGAISNINNIKKDIPYNLNTALCSHFKYNPYVYADSRNEVGFIIASTGFVFIRFSNNSEINTLEKANQWLAEQYANGTPVIIEYDLAEETIDPYTLEQQTAYNKLKEMQSYYDLTYVTGLSDNAQPILTAHAKKSIKQLSGGDLSNYQTKITSTNKLNSDLVDDTNQTNKFVTTSEKNTWDAKQNPTDNNLTTTNKNITSAINEVNSIAKGANQALSYASYSAMITAFNSASSTDYNVGQNIYIETLEVPDLWVYKVESTSSSYTYTTDSAFTTALETNGYVQVGYYKLSALETQKVDLTNYVENTDYATSSTAGVGKVGAGTGINISAGGVFYIASATSSEINAKTNSFKPIVPTNLDYAVSNIVGHHVTLTQTQYEALVSGGTVDSNTFYYTTEDTQE